MQIVIQALCRDYDVLSPCMALEDDFGSCVGSNFRRVASFRSAHFRINRCKVLRRRRARVRGHVAALRNGQAR